MKPQPENADVKDAAVFSIVTVPPAHSVEIENPTLRPREGLCNECRDNPGDIFCDNFPICFDCLEKLIEYENGIGILNAVPGKSRYRMRSDYQKALGE